MVVTFRVPVGDTARILVGGTEQVTPQVTPQATPQVVLLLEAAQEPRTQEQLQAALGLRDRHHFVNAYLDPLLRSGWLERTIPDKLKSPLQRYRTTAAGLRALKEHRS